MRRDALEAGERRRYIRLDSVFPVQFRLLSLDGKTFLSDWLQGFTNNVGKGGICLCVNNLNPEFTKALEERRAKLSLKIEMPLGAKPVIAKAQVAWLKEDSLTLNKYLIGLSYEEINQLQNNRLMRYAWMKKLFMPLVLSVIVVLALAITINTIINVKLIKGNKALVEQLVKIVQESSVAKQKIKEIDKGREDLQVKIKTLEVRIQILGEEKLSPTGKKDLEELDNLIGQLLQEKSSLQEQLIALGRKESAITEQLLRLDERKATLGKANSEKMYQWLRARQNLRTGLVSVSESYRRARNPASSYEQALVAIAYINFSDFSRARKIFNFFSRKAKREKQLFFSAYYDNGRPAAYCSAQANIWLGIALLHYTVKTQDTRYLNLAEEVAKGIIDLQDKDGPIRGASWGALNSLDAYAFFNMLRKITGKPEYGRLAEQKLTWLIADTDMVYDYAWSIVAIGPEKLEELGSNPDRIVEFSVFTAHRDLVRSGQGSTISEEWTAQTVMALKIMADFYYKKNMIAKARSYALKADEYLSSLSNMILSSPSSSAQKESCLAGTVYTLFAYYNYNPLKLQD